MGMAAGQARLLSITTRMSDNELRAQLINNDKMRLATKSAQVSEAYTTALNEAQMMFTNYDADNKTSYKELTYNALTAYNPYNNQYAISNASGQVLVSETDATNFKNANGDLNTFLASYGLEYSTDYFSSLISTNVVKNGSVTVNGQEVKAPYLAYKTGEFDADNKEIYNYISFADYSKEGNKVAGATLEEVLQNLYNGVDKTHPGYDATKSSLDYLNYTGDLANYTSAMNSMYEIINDKMQNELVKKSSGGFSFDKIEAGLMAENVEMADAKKYLDALYGIIGSKEDKSGLYEYATPDGIASIDSLKGLLEINKGENIQNSWASEGATIKASSDLTGNITLNYSESGGSCVVFKKTGDSYTMEFPKKEAGDPFTANGEATSDGNNIVFTYYVNDNGDYSTTSADGYTECKTTVPASLFNKPSSAGIEASNWALSDTEISSITDSEPNTVDNMKTIGLQIINTLQNSITNIWNFAASDGTNGAFSKFTDAKLAGGKFQTFLEAAKKFYKDMFGDEITSNPDSSDDILFKMNNIEELKKAINAKAKNTENDNNATPEAKAKAKAAAESFKKIYDVYILDCVMNTYGEPKFTWIDQNNKNANGEHKAQWYTNLFNRMKTGGYKTLQDGLASSTEWIKFAFESGLVTLEQVDGSNTWNSTTYSNCSDITEQTNSTAVTIAEAEYNAQMNKIQNKDKMYDLELKNIDTEHNSLQTEYESIKGAIDKNIERTFKIYS